MDKLKVFIIDDSAVIRARLADIVFDMPEAFLVGEASNISGFLDSIYQLFPTVVILDIHVPEDNGIEELQRLKEMYPALKVIILTNFSYMQYREKCYATNVDYFFDKSSEFGKIPDALEQMRQNM